MNLNNVILGFLSERPMSGYEIKQMMENSVGFFYDASFGGIYPALRKLEKDGMVEKQVIPQEGKPNKNLFAITEDGKAMFNEYLGSPVAPTTMRSDILIRIFFARFTSPQRVLNWLQEEKDRNEKFIAQLKMIQQGNMDMDHYQHLTLQFGMRNTESIITLLDGEIDRLLKEKRDGKKDE